MISSEQQLIGLLRASYVEATQDLLPFLEYYRTNQDAKYCQQRHAIVGIFEKSSWMPVTTKSGHITFKHPVTRIVIGLQAHGENTVAPKQMDALVEQVQRHVNILGNEIFCYTFRNWKDEPNYKESCARYLALRETEAKPASSKKHVKESF